MLLRSIIVSGIWVSGGILLGRVAGFIRESSLAATFGVSEEADIAILALTVPDLMVNLLVAGGLSAALIPEFRRYGDSFSGALFIQCSVFVLIVFSFITLSLVMVSDYLVLLLAPGFEGETVIKASSILDKVLWLIPLTVLAGISTAYLHSMNRFFVPSMGTFIFNAFVVAGLLLFIRRGGGLDTLVLFILAGGLARWLSQLFTLNRRIKFRKSIEKLLLSKEIFHRYWQAVVAIGMLSLFPVIIRSFASLEGEGNLAISNYALRLIEFPLGVLITVLAVVLFPRLSDCFEKGDKGGFSVMLTEGMKFSILIAFAVMCSVIAASDAFVWLVFDWNEIPANKLTQISLLVSIGIFSLPFQAIAAMSVVAFNAQRDTKTPMVINAIALLLLLLFCWRSEGIVGIEGIFLALVISYIIIAAICLLRLSSRKNISINILKFLQSFLAPSFLILVVAGGGTYLFGVVVNENIILAVGAVLFSFLSLFGVIMISEQYRLIFYKWLKGFENV